MNCHFSKIASLLMVAVSIPVGACTMAAGEPSRFRSDAFIQKLKDLESFTDSISFNGVDTEGKNFYGCFNQTSVDGWMVGSSSFLTGYAVHYGYSSTTGVLQTLPDTAQEKVYTWQLDASAIKTAADLIQEWSKVANFTIRYTANDYLPFIKERILEKRYSLWQTSGTQFPWIFVRFSWQEWTENLETVEAWKALLGDEKTYHEWEEKSKSRITASVIYTKIPGSDEPKIRAGLAFGNFEFYYHEGDIEFSSDGAPEYIDIVGRL